MTTAHRPTWTAALAGGGSRGNYATGGVSMQFSARQQTSHTKLKFRVLGQNNETGLARNSKREALVEAEAKARAAKPGSGEHLESAGSVNVTNRLMITADDSSVSEIAKRYDDSDDDNISSDSSASEDDDSDDEEALQRELEKIKREREAARIREEEESNERAVEARRAEALTGNELLNPSGSSQVKRRWNDDVVFKGQASTDATKKKRFINDTIRSDFHKAFLSKYIH